MSGEVFDDPHEVYDQGEETILGPFSEEPEDCGSYFIFKQGNIKFRADKDEELRD